MLTDNEIKRFLHTENVKIFSFDSIDSTSTYARRLVDGGEEGIFLVTAERQSDGRGRNGKSFYSANDGSVYMSVVLRPNLPFAQTVGVTTAAAVAVSRAVELVTGKKTDIKWVNDLYYCGKKVCGILCEAVARNGVISAVIIGVGINLAECDFPTELSDVAGTLGCDAAVKAELIAAVADGLFSLCFGELSSDLLDEYRERSLVIGRRIDYFVNGIKNTACAIGIDEQGGLVIKSDDGAVDVLRSGEISVRLNT